MSSGRGLKNILILFAAEGVSKAVLLFTSVYLAGRLGPDQFGRLSFALVYVSYFVLACDAGTSPIGVKLVAQAKRPAKDWVRIILSARLVVLVPLVIVLALTVVCIPSLHALARLILYYAISLGPAVLLLEWYYMGKEEAGTLSLGRVVQHLSYAAVVFLFIRSADRVTWVPLAYSASALLGTAILLGRMFFREGLFLPLFRIPELKSLAKQSLPVAAAQFAATAVNNLDSVLLGFMATPAIVGLYSAAYKIINIGLVLSTVVVIALSPRLAADATDDTRLPQSAGLYVRILAMVGFPLGAATFLYAEPLIRLLYRPEYLGSVPALKILAWSIPLSFLSVAFVNPQVVWDRERVYLSIVAGGAMLNLGANLVLIPWMGMPGAAWATVLCLSAMVAGGYLAFRQRVRIDLWKNLLMPALCTGLMVGVLLALSRVTGNLAVQWGGGAASYLLVLGVTRTLTRKDWEAFEGPARGLPLTEGGSQLPGGD